MKRAAHTLGWLLCAVAAAGGIAATADAPTTRATDPTFERWCAHCHRAGLYMAGTAGLQAKYQGAEPALLEQRTDLTVDMVKVFVRRGSNSMAPFRKTEISDAELEALARYLARKPAERESRP